MKRKKIYIMNGDIPVAESRGDNYLYRINPEVEAPIDLFRYGVNKINKVQFGTFLNWVKTRTFPEERCGADELLQEMGLKKYDPMAQASITDCQMAQDSFWVKRGD